MKDVCFVFGTYNRRVMLESAVHSIRRCSRGVSYDIAVIDGGSKDGSREWLADQEDVALILQEEPLSGAVRAFNLGFAHAVDCGHRFVFHFNDDAELITDHSILSAVEIMDRDPKVGAVAFEFNLRGPWDFEYINGHLYSNFGLIRSEAGIQVARKQGDPTGRKWWNPIYRTYGADSEFGCWLWKLGWTVYAGKNLRVHDRQANDELRTSNECYNPNRKDSSVFWDRWRNFTGP